MYWVNVWFYYFFIHSNGFFHEQREVNNIKTKKKKKNLIKTENKFEYERTCNHTCAKESNRNKEWPEINKQTNKQNI